ncbi:aspartate aminotransferase family protein [Streptomyces sp. TSRI0384-2]|uniref:Amino acid decarboxylase n=2 Tax=Streptomyces diastaticus group TaxID=2849069 RepID=A0ABQ1CN44_STRDI|nr:MULTISPECIES: aminotransferase class V-fold PLP-dependent enzyme [Streptomyces]NEE34785.1 aspartate aminotransferase family protein [Streptomyces sp. SID7982]NEE52707.1 aspartate aminotransferase family protein [Streptomyces sp. SID8455]PJM85456.1 aspartate aminotransferase family protein [Streptomyces sp. TSRI0384-2]QNE80688.1 aminotransferase class V-fold PLP-dependent enzyme [Streptomyces rutgersensis]GFH71574.1 amino acid decarboxylase [Streptomyces diastaticus subsp. diastaticus]
MNTPPLAGGTAGPDALAPLLAAVLDALRTGALDRGGPLPAGGPTTTARRVHTATRPLLPDHGTGPEAALGPLVHALTQGAADPADPLCAAHLHAPPLALAAAADLAASVLNPSLDSWDQAPAASALEAELTRTLARETYPAADHPDALLTTGGTEANQLALLLARERHPAAPLHVVHGANAHHSVPRAAWLLGLPPTHTVPTPTGTLDPAALHHTLTTLTGHPVLVAATAGTTDAGHIDPLPALADVCAAHGAELHVDAAYGGPLLFSDRRKHALHGLDRAHSVTLDLHKLGWQPVAAGILAVHRTGRLGPLQHTADYLNSHDDTEAGLPDLLGRSLRTTRRPDAFKMAVTLRALGRDGLGALVDQVCDLATTLADKIHDHPDLTLYTRPALSTVLFRPTDADDDQVAAVRRGLLDDGHAVLGRARAKGRLWLKATLLNPHTRPGDLDRMLKLVEGHTPR